MLTVHAKLLSSYTCVSEIFWIIKSWKLKKNLGYKKAFKINLILPCNRNLCWFEKAHFHFFLVLNSPERLKISKASSFQSFLAFFANIKSVSNPQCGTKICRVFFVSRWKHASKVSILGVPVPLSCIHMASPETFTLFTLFFQFQRLKANQIQFHAKVNV